MRNYSILLVLLAFAACSSSQACGQDDSLREHLRRYSDGPLTANDFGATVPDPRPRENGVQLEAFTFVDIAYDFRYRSQDSASRTRLTLKSIEVYAVVHRSKSWNLRESSKDLLDHEQGHFDLAAIFALRMQLDFDKQLDEGRGITTTGANEKDAALAMRRDIDRLIRAASEEMVKANQEYDRVTAHGSRRAAQQRERRKQIDELTRLVGELKNSK